MENQTPLTSPADARQSGLIAAGAAKAVRDEVMIVLADMIARQNRVEAARDASTNEVLAAQGQLFLALLARVDDLAARLDRLEGIDHDQ